MALIQASVQLSKVFDFQVMYVSRATRWRDFGVGIAVNCYPEDFHERRASHKFVATAGFEFEWTLVEA